MNYLEFSMKMNIKCLDIENYTFCFRFELNINNINLQKVPFCFQLEIIHTEYNGNR